MKIKFTGALIASLTTMPLFAETTSTDTVKLQEINVTAPVKSRVVLTPLDVSVVTQTDIQQSAESSLLPVIQNLVPGFFVSERGFAGYGMSGGAAGTVGIRGVGGGNKVLFMIDGQPQWAGVFGHALPDTYVANGVERIEIVKGPSSLLYGSNAMGGSVNIITKHQSQEGITGSARAMIGSFSTQKFNVSTGYRKDKVSATVSAQLDRSNGNREGSEFWLANEYAHVQYDMSTNWRGGANLDMSQTRAHNPGTTQSPLEDMWTRLTRGTASIYLNNSYGKFNGGVQAFINWGTNTVDDGHAPGAAPRNYIFHSSDYHMGFTVFQTVNPWQGNDLSAGIDFQHWGGKTWNVSREDMSTHTFDFSACENEIAGYVMMQQSLFKNFVSLNAGLRAQHGSQYGNILIPQAGFIIHPKSAASIKFSFSKGFRAPNLKELYLYAPANPELKPEYMYNYELSYSQHLLSGRLYIEAALYFINGRDMIQTVMIDGRGHNMNVGRFINKGFELQASWRFTPQWTLSTSYAYLHTSNLTIYAPKNKLDNRLMFTPGSWEFTLSNNNIWSLVNGNPVGTESYSLLNLRAAYTMQAHVPVKYFVRIDNINNKRYEVMYGCPMPGTTFMGGIEFRF